MMFARLAMPVARQPGRAAAAMSTACPRVVASAKGRVPVCSPVAGLYTAPVRFAVLIASPPIRWWRVSMSLRVLVIPAP